MARAVELLGFSLVRQSGSHRIYRNAEGRRVTPPFHAGRVLHPKLLLSIMREAGISQNQLRDIL
jgi:predicted RNA binding protein YcfA (HicA-like mRNA interferase family)